LPERFRPDSINTSILALYCDYEFVPNNTLFLLRLKDKVFAKIMALSVNSIVYLTDFYLFKQEATYGYTHIKATDFVLFHVLNAKELTKRVKDELLELFEKCRKIAFPSIIDQLTEQFPTRVEIDSTILRILGLTEKEIHEWLPKLYSLLAKELQTKGRV